MVVAVVAAVGTNGGRPNMQRVAACEAQAIDHSRKAPSKTARDIVTAPTPQPRVSPYLRAPRV